jgi:sulfur carrier protein ThiS adenylyltransferase
MPVPDGIIIGNKPYFCMSKTKGAMTDELKKYCVGIAGCGGLGSNCAVALARVGIGRLVIADYDVVDKSNLNRQYYFIDQIGRKKTAALMETLRRINPDVKVSAHDKQLTSQDILPVFSNCDVIVEALDDREMKRMLIEIILTELPGKPLVIASGLAGWGNNNALTTRSMDNVHVCGDETSETGDDMPPLAPRVGIVANMQANQVLEILLGAMK